MNPSVKKHIEEYVETRSSGLWLPELWSEDDAELRKALIEELGSSEPSEYMSEEYGWKIPASED